MILTAYERISKFELGTNHMDQAIFAVASRKRSMQTHAEIVESMQVDTQRRNDAKSEILYLSEVLNADPDYTKIQAFEGVSKFTTVTVDFHDTDCQIGIPYWNCGKGMDVAAVSELDWDKMVVAVNGNVGKSLAGKSEQLAGIGGKLLTQTARVAAAGRVPGMRATADPASGEQPCGAILDVGQHLGWK